MFSGLSLLYPLALLSALAIAIPLAIHLFNRAKPKTIMIGSVRLIPRTAQQPVNQLRIEQRLLLVARVSLILLLTLFLAQVWNHQTANNVAKDPIILVTPQWLALASEQDKLALAKDIGDSESYILGRQLKPLSIQDLEQTSAVEQSVANTITNVWATLAIHLNQWPQEQQLQVYTTDQASQFVGSKTPLTKHISWNVLEGHEQTSTKPSTFTTPMSVTLVYDNNSQVTLQRWQGALSFLTENGFTGLSYQALQKAQMSQGNVQTWYVDLTQSEPSEIWRHPQLNALVAQTNHAEFILSLAQTLIALSQQQGKQISGHLSAEQIAALAEPTHLNNGSVSIGRAPTWWSWLVLLIVVLFFFERWLSENSVYLNKEVEDK